MPFAFMRSVYQTLYFRLSDQSYLVYQMVLKINTK